MTKLITITFLALLLLLAFGTWSYVHAADYTDDQIVSAIYKAEGGDKTRHPFGILSVECDGYEECRRICMNTVHNNRARFESYGHLTHNDYLSFLASRYCPVGASNDATGLNFNWLSNMRSILERDN